MYAVIVSGGKQYKVSEGDVVRVETLPAEVGDTVELDNVLLVHGSAGVSVGKPYVEGAKVTATVKSQSRAKKIIVFKHHKNYKRTQGHRQNYTALHIDKIQV
jgi:large subunit ribosomal protein L21